MWIYSSPAERKTNLPCGDLWLVEQVLHSTHPKPKKKSFSAADSRRVKSCLLCDVKEKCCSFLVWRVSVIQVGLPKTRVPVCPSTNAASAGDMMDLWGVQTSKKEFTTVRGKRWECQEKPNTAFWEPGQGPNENSTGPVGTWKKWQWIVAVFTVRRIKPKGGSNRLQ